MKRIYILLSKTKTLPSRMIYRLTRGAYTHTSIALTEQTDRFYSFARRKLHNILNAGFFVEDLNSFVFAKHAKCYCSLYALEVSEEGYEKIQRRIEDFEKNYKKAKYNFLGMLPLRLGIRFPRKYKLACSQFVAVVLDASGEIALPKDPYVMLPNDFQKIPGIRKIYEGTIEHCSFESLSDVDSLVGEN